MFFGKKLVHSAHSLYKLGAFRPSYLISSDILSCLHPNSTRAIKKTHTYSVSGSLSGSNPYLWLLAVDLNHEPSDVEHKSFLRKTRPFCPFSLQNWALFVHPVQSVQVFHPICTRTARKSGKATRGRKVKFQIAGSRPVGTANSCLCILSFTVKGKGSPRRC